MSLKVTRLTVGKGKTISDEMTSARRYGSGDKVNDIPMTAASCSLQILDRAMELDRAFGYLDLSRRFSYGTLRNNVSRLRRDGEILKLPRENPARFILSAWKSRPEYARALRSDSYPTRGRVKVVVGGLGFDFVGFVESLDWGELAFVHDVKLQFVVVSVPGVCSEAGWCWFSRSKSWGRRFEDLGFPLSVQVFDTGCVQVSVRCSLKPLPFNLEGLVRLVSVLGELKGRLGWSRVPDVGCWLVTSWHYGKDSVKEVAGVSFNVTFETWFGTFARIYAKSELRKIRAEEIQSPNRTVQEVFEDIVNRVEAVSNPRLEELE